MSRIAYFDCLHCQNVLAIAPVFHKIRGGGRHEALAMFAFNKEGKTERQLCRISLPGAVDSMTPARAAKRITPTQVNAWVWWKYQDGNAVITLDELIHRL